MPEAELDPERRRLADDGGAWRRWGPYLSERAWGTVREDYSHDGEAWTSFPHDHARSRAYRWSEDGLGGFCDTEQRLCLAFAFWNGQDPILKERIFGLTATRATTARTPRSTGGTSTPRRRTPGCAGATSIPSAPSPTRTSSRRTPAVGSATPSTSCSTPARSPTTATGTSRSTTRRPGRTTCCLRVRIRNAGPDAAELHVLPTLWFRNRGPGTTAREAPVIREDGGALVAHRRPTLTTRLLAGRTASPRRCSATTRRTRSASGARPRPPYPKDGINDHVVTGAPTVDPGPHRARRRPLWYRLRRRRRARRPRCGCGCSRGEPRPWARAGTSTRARPAPPRPTSSTPTLDPAPRRRTSTTSCARRSAGCCGASSSTTTTSTAGSTAIPASRRRRPSALEGRNAAWRHFDNLRRHLDAGQVGVPLVRGVGPGLPLRHARARRPGVRQVAAAAPAAASGSMHPNGAAARVRVGLRRRQPAGPRAGRRSRCSPSTAAATSTSSGAIFHKLLLNFTWWVNRQGRRTGNQLFEGGFLGLDNIGPFDRSAPLPDGLVLEQSDAHRLDGDLLPGDGSRSRSSCAAEDPAYEDLAVQVLRALRR